VFRFQASMAAAAHSPYATILPHPNFNVQEDVSALRAAMKGVGTDEKAIIQILAHRSSAQRQQIIVSYKATLGRDLIADLKSELSGNFERVVLAFMQDRFHYEAQSLRAAMKGVGTDESVLVELICTHTNDEIKGLTAAYTTTLHRDAEKDVISETSGNFKRLLVSLLQGARPAEGPVDPARAQADAKALHEAGEKRWGTDESKFNEIIAGRSFSHVWAVMAEYEKLAGHSLLKAIDSEMSGHLKEAYKAVLTSVINRPEFFADKLYHSMHGAGTDDETLIRIVVTRSEVDLAAIKAEFLKKHKKPLIKWIEDDCSGDYKRMLVAIVGA